MRIMAADELPCSACPRSEGAWGNTVQASNKRSDAMGIETYKVMWYEIDEEGSYCAKYDSCKAISFEQAKSIIAKRNDIPEGVILPDPYED